MDAIALLKADHDKVKPAHRARVDDRARGQDARPSCSPRSRGSSRVHEIIEEEIFYPELKAHPKAKDIVLEGYEEHHVVDLS